MLFVQSNIFGSTDMFGTSSSGGTDIFGNPTTGTKPTVTRNKDRKKQNKDASTDIFGTASIF